jgi:hypothetical protein
VPIIFSNKLIKMAHNVQAVYDIFAAMGLSRKYHAGHASVSSDDKDEDTFVFPGIYPVLYRFMPSFVPLSGTSVSYCIPMPVSPIPC